MFFTENSARFVEFQERIAKMPDDPAASGCSSAISVILDDVDKYDRQCKYLPEVSGKSMIKAMAVRGNFQKLTFILYFLTACVREVTMSATNISAAEQHVLDHFRSAEVASIPAWDGWYSFFDDSIFNLMPLRMVSNQLAGISERRDEIASLGERIREESSVIRTLSESHKEEMRNAAEQETKSLLNELKGLSDRIDGYRGELSKIAENYNFVGLSHAFKGLINVKRSETLRYFLSVLATGLLALGAPVAAAFLVDKNTFDGVLVGAWSVLATIKFVGIVGFELVLLYFFRIALKSFLLAKDQQVNLSLRLALCQFIEGYSDFSEKARERGGGVVKGFEDLIFSPLPANERALPPTIDGMDGIVKIVAALKSGK